MRGTSRQITTLVKRGFAAKIAAQRVPLVAASDTAPQVSRLPNGLLIATLEPDALVSRMAVIMNAGSRFETGENEGITHCLRNAANLTNKKFTGFHQTRSLHQIGAVVQCQTTREHMIYSLECMSNMAQYMLPAVTAMALFPSPRPHELEDAVYWRMKQDKAYLEKDASTVVLEELHRAVYRNGLGHSLYCPDSLIASHDIPDLKAFTDKHYTLANAVLVATGVDHDDLVATLSYETDLPKESGAVVKPAPCVFHAGKEARVKTTDKMLTVSLAMEGAGLGSADVVPVALLQHLLGTGPTIKYSEGETVLSRTVAACTDNPFAVSAFNLNYTDTGMLGVNLLCSSADAGKILTGITTTLPTLTFTEADLARAKALLKSAVAYSFEETGSAVQDLATQLLSSGNFIAPETCADMIDAASLDTVNEVARRVLGSKASMTMRGDTTHAPYLDDLQ